MDYSPKHTDRPERDEYRNRFSFAEENTVRSKKPKTKTDYFVRLILLQCVLCAAVRQLHRGGPADGLYHEGLLASADR